MGIKLKNKELKSVLQKQSMDGEHHKQLFCLLEEGLESWDHT